MSSKQTKERMEKLFRESYFKSYTQALDGGDADAERKFTELEETCIAAWLDGAKTVPPIARDDRPNKAKALKDDNKQQK